VRVAAVVGVSEKLIIRGKRQIRRRVKYGTPDIQLWGLSCRKRSSSRSIPGTHNRIVQSSFGHFVTSSQMSKRNSFAASFFPEVRALIEPNDIRITLN